MVFCGLFPIESQPVRGAARRAREALAQRRRAVLGARELRRARLRLPLRLPRPAAHGHRARAPGARVRRRPDGDDAVGRVRADAHRRRASARSTTRPTCPTRRASPRSASRSSAPRSSRRRTTSARSWSSARSAAASTRACTSCPPSAYSCRYDLPLAEIVIDFFDPLKSRTRGYAWLNYALNGHAGRHLVKLDILVDGEAVDALSIIVHPEKAHEVGRALIEKLARRSRASSSTSDPGGDRRGIIARETVKA